VLASLKETEKSLVRGVAIKGFETTTKGESSVLPSIAGSAAKAIGGFSGYASRQRDSRQRNVDKTTASLRAANSDWRDSAKA
jgi:hypothetical protein